MKGPRAHETKTPSTPDAVLSPMNIGFRLFLLAVRFREYGPSLARRNPSEHMEYLPPGWRKWNEMGRLNHKYRQIALNEHHRKYEEIAYGSPRSERWYSENEIPMVRHVRRRHRIHAWLAERVLRLTWRWSGLP